MILVVDDSPEICRLLDRQLTLLGKRVITASGIRDADDHLRVHNFDVVLVDLLLDRGEIGTKILSLVEQSYPHIIRVLMSGFVGVGDMNRTIRSGLTHTVLHKPWTMGQLRTVVSFRDGNLGIHD
jgi:DNA-binding NtrC family response regulator